MFIITKEFHFSASHILEGLPEGHPCSRLHGHNYVVVIELASAELDDRGFVVDYGDLKTFKDYIDNRLDHQHLNDVLVVPSPTAEWIAKHLYEVAKDMFHQVVSIRVSETPKTWATYTELIPGSLVELTSSDEEISTFPGDDYRHSGGHASGTLQMLSGGLL